MLRQPVLEKRIRHPDGNGASAVGDKRRRLEPGVETVPVHLCFDPRENLIPDSGCPWRGSKGFSCGQGLEKFRENPAVSPDFSTIFSTGVENLGKKPKGSDGCRRTARSGPGNCSTRPTIVDTPLRRWLVLKIPRVNDARHRARPMRAGKRQDQHERKAHLPAQQPPPEENARLPGADVDEERAHRSQASPGERPQAADCR